MNLSKRRHKEHLYVMYVVQVNSQSLNNVRIGKLSLSLVLLLIETQLNNFKVSFLSGSLPVLDKTTVKVFFFFF